jgi:hypothetical protein
MKRFSSFKHVILAPLVAAVNACDLTGATAAFGYAAAPAALATPAITSQQSNILRS